MTSRDSEPTMPPERIFVGIGDSERRVFQYYSAEREYANDAEYVRADVIERESKIIVKSLDKST